MDQRYRIGFDIGGTFTDFVLLDAEREDIRLHKRLTTPEDPSRCAIEGLRAIVNEAGITLAEVGELIHGTTLVTNALIERKGAKLGLITTQGFRDVLEMGTEQRYDIYDLFLKFPEPLVPRRRRYEVPERMDRDGRVVTGFDEDAMRAAIQALDDQEVEAIAICFLHSYRNPTHEKRAAQIVREIAPELSVSISSDVVAELSEYQRTVTTCANAYVLPLVDRYVSHLEAEVASLGFRGQLRLIHSAGGTLSPAAARAYPIRLLESGPAGGALATAIFGRRASKSSVISFDMGGTTAKACLIEDGKAAIAPAVEAARTHRFKKGSGLPIKAPVVEMIEIGAGGGSIAWIDEVGLLRVGPMSAGADPGPACYGNGGLRPTVTDANVALGYYDPDFFLGGAMRLDAAAARQAIATVAAPLKLDLIETAWGIFKIVVESMADATRVHLAEKGKDPRNYAMVGFGGAGPAHACEVARSLGVKEVIIPPASGAASAIGFLAAPLSFEFVRSRPVTLSGQWNPEPINAVLAELEEEGARMLREAGASASTVRIERAADMRLAGQIHEITVKLPDGKITRESEPAIQQAFRSAYAARYTSVYEGAGMQILNLRVRCWAPSPDLELRQSAVTTAAPKKKGTRAAWFGNCFVDTPVYNRYQLSTGDHIEGPAIIEERESTTVLSPLDCAEVDESGNLRIAIGDPTRRAVRIERELPIEEAVKRIESDPVGLEIMWSRLVTVVDEMWLTVCRTAFSLIIAEAQDFACELLDRNGETLAHSPRAMPVFNLTLPRAVKALLEKFPPDQLEPGDLLITNDPWLCAGHLFDLAIVMPVFKEGLLVGLLGTVGHVSDIGGTKDSLQAREIYEEGIQIPPIKLMRRGQANEDLLALLAENVRNPRQVLGDIHAFIAANRLGAERLCAFMDEYGLANIEALAAIFQSRSERAMREAIRRLPDGVYRSEAWSNPLGTPLRMPVKITVCGDEIEVDFEGAPVQLPQGGLNCTLNYTMAHGTYPLKCMLTPDVRGNAGCYKPFTVKAPEGSILNCRKPASVNVRTRTGWYLAPAIFRALAESAPDRVQSFTGLPVAINIYGYERGGRLYSDHLFMGGGQGASQHHDGKSSLLWPTSAANTSVELFETRVPALVLEKSYVADSGGPGRHRGGLGQRVRLRKLEDDGQPTIASLYPEGVAIETPGLFGGSAGGRAFGAVRAADGALLKDCGTGELVTLADTRYQLELVLAGGSGFGDPMSRLADLVAEDIADGYVSLTAAKRDYGAALAQPLVNA
jgi:5-oxoprolinase (ATP-hydrolysing)/N-methylhydantoinase A